MPYAQNICKDTVETIEQLGPNDCLISINNTTNDPWNLKVSGEKVCRVFFDDVIFSFRNPQDGLVYNAISHEHVAEILNFIEKWNGHNFTIACHAGLSRSAAVDLFLRSCYNYDLKPNYWVNSTPNPMILGLLVHEFYRRKIN